MRSEQSWSLIDPKPVLLYLTHHDDYIVYWNGVVMPHNMALCMAMEYFGIYPTPEMKTAMEKNYEILYYAGAFNTRAWDSRVGCGPVYSYLKRIMKPHVEKLTENNDPNVVIGWFDYKKSRRELA